MRSAQPACQTAAHPLQAGHALTAYNAAREGLAGTLAALPPPSAGLPDALVVQLVTAMTSVQEAAERSLPAGAPPARSAAQLRKLLQPAAHLAALMQQYYALPAVEAERQLALAQAAPAAPAPTSAAPTWVARAGRRRGRVWAACAAGGQWVVCAQSYCNCERRLALQSCACLCAALAVLTLHPMHPTFCSACRAVWYCGTACSHADWREGGHRRVCKALGAARRAAKEAAAAAGAGLAADE